MVYQYLILFPAVVIEGPVATILASFLASPAGGNILNIWIVFIIVFIGDLVGDTMYYAIGRYGKLFFTKRYPRRFSIKPERLTRIENYYRQHGVKTIIVGKVSHGLGWPIMVGAGSAGMPYGLFIRVNSVVSVFKSALLVGAGYYYGEHYEALVRNFGKGGVIISTGIVVVVIYFIFRNVTKNKELR